MNIYVLNTIFFVMKLSWPKTVFSLCPKQGLNGCSTWLAVSNCFHAQFNLAKKNVVLLSSLELEICLMYICTLFLLSISFKLANFCLHAFISKKLIADKTACLSVCLWSHYFIDDSVTWNCIFSHNMRHLLCYDVLFSLMSLLTIFD